MEKTNPIGQILTRALLEASLEKVRAQQAENARQTIAEIRELGDSIEYGELLAWYVPLTDKNVKVSDAQRASGAVGYAALYPTFGHQGIELLINEWKTAAPRRNSLLSWSRLLRSLNKFCLRMPGQKLIPAKLRSWFRFFWPVDQRGENQKNPGQSKDRQRQIKHY